MSDMQYAPLASGRSDAPGRRRWRALIRPRDPSPRPRPDIEDIAGGAAGDGVTVITGGGL